MVGEEVDEVVEEDGVFRKWMVRTLRSLVVPRQLCYETTSRLASRRCT